jgi:hypothetical protein
MIVDLRSRKRIADFTGEFLAGNIDNFELCDRLFDLKTGDRMCIELRRQIAFFYSDTPRYRNLRKRKLPDEAAAILER